MNFSWLLLVLSCVLCSKIDFSCSNSENLDPQKFLFQKRLKLRNRVGKKLQKPQTLINSLPKDEGQYSLYPYEDKGKGYQKYLSTVDFDEKELYCLKKVSGIGVKSLKLIALFGLKTYWFLKFISFFVVIILIPLLALTSSRPIVQVILVDSDSSVTETTTMPTTPITTSNTTTVSTTPSTPSTTTPSTTTQTTTPTTTTTFSSIGFTCPPCLPCPFVASHLFERNSESGSHISMSKVLPSEITSILKDAQQSCIERILCFARYENVMNQTESNIKWNKDKISSFILRVLQTSSSLDSQQLIARITFLDTPNVSDCKTFKCTKFNDLSNFIYSVE